jgi:vacuolar-type H+-ATPase subunit I/STV1
MVGGALFGDFFGFSYYASELVLDAVGMSIPHGLVFESLWFEPIPHNVERLFIVTMLIGAMHMGLGLAFHGMNNFSNRDILGGISGVVKIWPVWSALFIASYFRVLF